jgi:TRAP-type mannitol/chloroaromatic compound transport system permease small subunit
MKNSQFSNVLFKENIGSIDRLIRLTAGTCLLVMFLLKIGEGMISQIIAFSSIYLLSTSYFAFSILYFFSGITTMKKNDIENDR